jgi:hypothetical protein
MLKAGTIDAGLQPFPLSYEAEDAGFTNLGWTGTWEPESQFTAVMVNDAWDARRADPQDSSDQASEDAHRTRPSLRDDVEGAHPKRVRHGDRVRIAMSGKFLPYKKY